MLDTVATAPAKGSKGSLQAAIDKLLKTIDLIESTIMVPTLLRDKCAFDANHLLKVANIIRASIKGEYDTMESLIDDINSTNSGENNGMAISCSMPNVLVLNGNNYPPPQQSILTTVYPSPTMNRQQQQQQHQQQQQQQQHQQQINSASTNPVTSGSCDTSNSASFGPLSLNSECSPGGNGINMLKLDSIDESPTSDQPITIPPIVPIVINNRTAQPPSLLQLTTNNNHMNQLRSPNPSTQTNNGHLQQETNGLLTSSPNSEMVNLSDQINSLQKSLVLANNSPGYQSGNCTPVGNSLINNNNNNNNCNNNNNANGLTPNSIGSSLLKRTYSSGAMSPYGAPQTPIFSYPQAESLHHLNEFGDPSASEKLLGEIEHLKVSLSTVTNLLESVVELYKKYVDNLYL